MPNQKRTFSYKENSEYQKEYQSKLKRILVSFNPNKDEDMMLWEHLRSKGAGKQIPYIKDLIRKDMKGSN